MAYYYNYYPTTTTTATAWTYTIRPQVITYNYQPSPLAFSQPATPRPETDLEWLDRRVKEVRVGL
jgi:hypothetical protein